MGVFYRARLLCLIVLAVNAFSGYAYAEVSVRDDTGASIKLAQPAQRIISLTPHITELLFAIGAGNRIVGAVDYSDYPEAAKRIPRIGGYANLDLEAIVALKPDLVIAWESGNSAAHIAKLRQLHVPIYTTQANRIEEVATTLERLGTLSGNTDSARKVATQFRTRLSALKEKYSSRPKVRTFYQIWKDPLMTVGGLQVISNLIQLCGGENVFASLQTMAPQVSVEAVIAANPNAIIASGMDESRPEWLDDWKRWPKINAVARDNLFFIPPDLVQRHTPRILDGAERLCTALEVVRMKGKKER